jgi:hypothetical protein
VRGPRYGSGKAKPIFLYGSGIGESEDDPSLRKKNKYMQVSGAGTVCLGSATKRRLTHTCCVVQDFEDAIECYLHGDWIRAKEGLEDCVSKREADPPPQIILKFMALTGYVCPADWLGWRHNDV